MKGAVPSQCGAVKNRHVKREHLPPHFHLAHSFSPSQSPFRKSSQKFLDLSDYSMAPSSSPLLRLPVELQTRIISWILPSSVHGVLFTCKQLYDIALPLSVHTYRDYEDTQNDTDDEPVELDNEQDDGQDDEPDGASDDDPMNDSGDDLDRTSDGQMDDESDDQSIGSTTDQPEDVPQDGSSGQSDHESDNRSDATQSDGPSSDGKGGISKPSRCLQFLRYITITKPHLAQHVKEIIIGNFPSRDDEPRREGAGCPSEEDMVVFRKLIKDLFAAMTYRGNKQEQVKWIVGLKRGVSDAVFATLLLVCPRLESLCFPEVYEAISFQAAFSFARRYREEQQKLKREIDEKDRKMLLQLPLGSLKDVYHESQDEKYGYLMWSVPAASLFCLPSVRYYECVMANGSDEVEETFGKIPPRSSTVEHIYLRKSCISQRAIRSIIGAVKTLRSFEYTRGVYHMYDDEMMPRNLMDAILPHATTLEDLYVNWEDDWDKGGWVEEPDKLFMGYELKNMTALKTLVTGMQALTGLLDGQPSEIFNRELPLAVDGAPRLVECLPQNLEHLEIHGCGQAILDQAQELLDTISSGTQFKSLKRVRFLFNSEKIDHEKVRLTCTSSSIRLDVVFQTPENRTYDLVQGCDDGVNGEPAMSLCSRIYAPKRRAQWLALRGSDVATATVDGGLLEAPSV